MVDGETGVLVPSGDPAALADGVRRAMAQAHEFGAAGGKRCLAHFELGPIVDAWEQVLGTVADR